MLRGLLFDLFGTLVHITTDEHDLRNYAVLARWLGYRGLGTEAAELRQLYRDTCQRLCSERLSVEAHPEIDVRDVFGRIISRLGGKPSARLATEICRLFRALTTIDIYLYPGAEELLANLRAEGLKIGLTSNAQAAYSRPEIAMLGLEKHLAAIVLSSEVGCQKPCPAIFERTLNALRLNPAEAIFVGNDLFADIQGAQAAGMRTIFFQATIRTTPWEVTPEAAVLDGSMATLRAAIDFVAERMAQSET